jgi:hypothetical protein
VTGFNFKSRPPPLPPPDGEPRWFKRQSEFDAWAERTGRGKMAWLIVAMVLLMVATVAALAVMGPRLMREAPLLWYGIEAEATIDRVRVEAAGSFKDGAKKHRVTIDYTFVGPHGVSFSGQTERGDVRFLPEFETGQRLLIRYQPDNPKNSVADYNLAIDIYALLLFLPFLAVIGLGYSSMVLIFALRRRLRGA